MFVTLLWFQLEHKVHNGNPQAESKKLKIEWSSCQNSCFLNKCCQISAAIKIKLPATNTRMYCLATYSRLTIASPITIPIKEKKFTMPLQGTVWMPVNLFVIKIATSLIYLGI